MEGRTKSAIETERGTKDKKGYGQKEKQKGRQMDTENERT